MKIIRKTYDWMGQKVHSKYADWWLIALFFIESSFLVIPVDPLLILFCIENNKRAFYYALISTVSSVVGGLFGYFIGAVLWKSVGVTLVTWLISEATFYDLVAKYKKYQVIAVLIAGFCPVPYKAVTISAGFCHLPLAPFTFFSFVARGGRFFLIAAATRIWGERIKNIIDHYFNQLVVVFILLVIFSCWVLK